MAALDSLKTYNADEVAITLGPVIMDRGFAEDEFIRIEWDTTDTEDTVGVDGEVTVSRTNDRRATVTVILSQTSDINDQLSVLNNLARSAPGMTGAIQPFALKDLNGRTLYASQNAWVMSSPSASFARTAQPREWQIRCANLVATVGGN
jgi:hypothetical protein